MNAFGQLEVFPLVSKKAEAVIAVVSDPRFRLPVRRSDRNLAVARAISYRVLGRRQHSVPLTGILTRMAHSPSELVWLLLALLAGGALTGILAGLFGIGGGTIMVPVLYQLLGCPVRVKLRSMTVRSFEAKGTLMHNSFDGRVVMIAEEAESRVEIGCACLLSSNVKWCDTTCCGRTS
jgi:Sulfite exporter TauE/SafE